VTSGIEPLQGVIESQRAEAVRRAVLTLPDRYRDAILLFYFDEQSLSDAARVLGRAEGTLKARLHRGRELLRKKCAKLGPLGALAPLEEP
jgi:RNA polymerase sigma-70 factor (ECF subfamily)